MRARAVIAVCAVITALVGVACSDGATFDGSISQRRDAAPAAAPGIPGANDGPLDLDRFCSSNKTPDVCFVLVDATRAFSKPFVLGSKIALTVPDFCTGDGYFPELGGHTGSGCWGGLMYYDYYRPLEASGRLTPNPFTDRAAMLFKANGPWSGTSPTLTITGVTAPFIDAGRGATAYYSSPFSGSNEGTATDGTYLAITLDPTSFGPKDYRSRPVFTVTNRAVRVRVQNSATSVSLKAENVEGTGDRFLVDPVARSANAASIPGGASAFHGGYRAVSERSTFTISYRIADASGSTISSPGCPGCGARVVATFDYDPTSPTPTAASSCEVTNVSAIAVYTCKGATVSGDGELLTFTVNFREGS